MDLYIYILIIINIVTLIYLLFKDTNYPIPLFPNSLNYFLLFIPIVLFTFEEISTYSDKYKYLNDFNNIEFSKVLKYKDVGFSIYTYIIKLLFNNSNIYFFITACIYLYSYYAFIKKYIPKYYRYILLLGFISSFGFYAYGSNTLRAGLGLSFVLLSYAYKDKKILFILLSIIAVFIHKSMILPIFGFLISNYYKNSKYFLIFWVLALIFSIINISPIISFFQENVMGTDDRGADYFSEKNQSRYKVGFRIDFLFYSCIPIVIGGLYIFKLKVKDTIYNYLYNTYLFSNAIWLIVIRMAFTDRVAYLSWFLIPFLLFYPIIKFYLPINQRKITILILLGIISFTTFMHFK